jgi:hypothetical protein
MIGELHAAMFAEQGFFASDTTHGGGEPSTIKEKNRLFATEEAIFHRLDKARTKEGEGAFF